MKLKVITLVIIISGICNLASGHNLVFKETFSNNRNEWKIYNNKDFKVDIRNGKLYMEKFVKNRISNGCLWYAKRINNFDTSKDFSITFYAKVIDWDDVSNSVDIQWGKINDDTSKNKISNVSLYQMDISESFIRLSYFNNQEGWTYYKWSNELRFPGKQPVSTAFKRNKFNKYEIIQKNNSLTIKVNNKTVYLKTLDFLVKGSCIGFQQCLKSSWEIDKIIIKQ
jgi:hypothetical protein